MTTQEAHTERYGGRTILITGAGGFLGSALVKALSQVDCRLVLLIRPGSDIELPGDAKAEVAIIRGDIQVRETWRKALDGAEYVFHFAAQTSTYVANENPEADLNANGMPVLQMLETCREAGFKPNILFAGSVTQSGIPEQIPVNEHIPDFPVTIYDIHKLLAEKYLHHYSSQEKLLTVTLRLANVYGPGVLVGSSDRGVLNLMVRRGLGGETLTVYGDGARVRDYIYIDDVVSAFLTAGAAIDVLAGQYYLIGSGQGTKIVDVINLVADRVQIKLGRKPSVKHVPAPAGMSIIENRDFIADTSRFASATGWQAKVSLIEGIDRTVLHYQGQNTAGAAI